MSFRDVKGYYRTLGVDPSAGADDVKRAYRQKVKQTHPDSGGDTDAFQALTDAYDVLGTPKSRAAYDRLCRTAGNPRGTAATAKPKPRGDAESAPRNPAGAKSAEPGSPGAAAAQSTATRPGPVPCRRCGTISAQPRHIIFRLVIGLLTRSYQRRIEGVYCRACADKVAVFASLVTWLLGWWSVPRGPLDTVRALTRNIAGGERPVDRNLDLLSRQAHAFAERGQNRVAGDLALQARQYGLAPGLDAIVARAGRQRLKNRWRVGGWSFVIQALPVGLVAAWLIVQTSSLAIATIKQQAARTTSDARPETTAPLPIEDRRFVEVAETIVRRGPDSATEAVDHLVRFDPVTVIDPTMDRGWLKVVTNAAAIGWIDAGHLTPGAMAADRRCAENLPPRPMTGEILSPLAAGTNSLGISNQTGRDAIVKLRPTGGGPSLSIFVRTDAHALVEIIPDGHYHLQYATGGRFSRRCQRFLDGMTSYRFAAPIAFESKTADDFTINQKVEIRLSADKTAKIHPVNLESFLVD